MKESSAEKSSAANLPRHGREELNWRQTSALLLNKSPTTELISCNSKDIGLFVAIFDQRLQKQALSQTDIFTTSFGASLRNPSKDPSETILSVHTTDGKMHRLLRSQGKIALERAIQASYTRGLTAELISTLIQNIKIAEQSTFRLIYEFSIQLISAVIFGEGTNAREFSDVLRRLFLGTCSESEKIILRDELYEFSLDSQLRGIQGYSFLAGLRDQSLASETAASYATILAIAGLKTLPNAIMSMVETLTDKAHSEVEGIKNLPIWIRALHTRPPMPVLRRTTTVDIDFNKFLIPEKTKILFPLVHNACPSVERSKELQLGSLYPFGSGPHFCLGAAFSREILASLQSQLVADGALVDAKSVYKWFSSPNQFGFVDFQVAQLSSRNE